MFTEHRKWPAIQDLQRRLDRSLGANNFDVETAAQLKPKVLNEARYGRVDTFTLQLRHLMWIGKAGPLVRICMQAINRGVASYFSDDDPPTVTSRDRSLMSPTDRVRGFGALAYEVLAVERPSPFGGSSMNDEEWTLFVDSRFARRFTQLESINDFVSRQDELRAEIATEISSIAGVVPAMIIEGRDLAPATPTPTDSEPVLFLSWGGEKSKKVAAVLDSLLRSRLPGVEVFFSPRSIQPGDDPTARLFDEGLLRSMAMVVVLTKEGAGRPYVIWETAVMWAKGRMIIPIFVDVDPSNVPGPLTQKAQGVFLDDRPELNRAIQQLASQYGIININAITDPEFDELKSAAQ